MSTAIPSIACIGVIGRRNNPLHITIFPSHDPATNTFTPARTSLQFLLFLSSTIDVFERRAALNAGGGTGLSGDLGLLHAIDDRLAAYGFETNTGVRFVVVVDMRGRTVDGSVVGGSPGGVAAMGLREGELKPVFRGMQNAYIRLLQNPFYDPDEQELRRGRPGKTITSKKFAAAMRRIGDIWTPGVTNL